MRISSLIASSNHLPNTPSPNAIILEVKASIYGFIRNPSSVHNTVRGKLTWQMEMDKLMVKEHSHMYTKLAKGAVADT